MGFPVKSDESRTLNRFLTKRPANELQMELVRTKQESHSGTAEPVETTKTTAPFIRKNELKYRELICGTYLHSIS